MTVERDDLRGKRRTNLDGYRKYKDNTQFTPGQLKYLQAVLDGEPGVNRDNNTFHRRNIAERMGEIPETGKAGLRHGAASRTINKGVVSGIVLAVTKGWVNTERLPSEVGGELGEEEREVWRLLMDGCSVPTLRRQPEMVGKNIPGLLERFYSKLGVRNEYQAIAVGVKIVLTSQASRNQAIQETS